MMDSRGVLKTQQNTTTGRFLVDFMCLISKNMFAGNLAHMNCRVEYHYIKKNPLRPEGILSIVISSVKPVIVLQTSPLL